jgi:hypothetical protein
MSGPEILGEVKALRKDIENTFHVKFDASQVDFNFIDFAIALGNAVHRYERELPELEKRVKRNPNLDTQSERCEANGLLFIVKLAIAWGRANQPAVARRCEDELLPQIQELVKRVHQI